MEIPKYNLGRGPVFTFSLAGGAVRTLPPVSYATDQVHFKHEQLQVILIESHVTIGTIQQRQDAAYGAPFVKYYIISDRFSTKTAISGRDNISARRDIIHNSNLVQISISGVPVVEASVTLSLLYQNQC